MVIESLITNDTLAKYFVGQTQDACQVAAHNCAEVIVAANNIQQVAMWSTMLNIIFVGALIYFVVVHIKKKNS